MVTSNLVAPRGTHLVPAGTTPGQHWIPRSSRRIPTGSPPNHHTVHTRHGRHMAAKWWPGGHHVGTMWGLRGDHEGVGYC